MKGLADFLAGKQVLEENNSPINGPLAVVHDLAWGTYIMAGGLTQSGGVAKGVWQTTLKKVKTSRFSPETCLILGLGGGSIAGLLRKFWSETKIVGVEIDPLMVELGKKYLGLSESRSEVVLQDALDYLRQTKKRFDLICVDTYVGDDFPAQFESLDFLQELKKHLNPRGRIVFNRLYYGEKRTLAMKFLDKLEKVFGKVEIVFPEANVMFICRPQPATIGRSKGVE